MYMKIFKRAGIGKIRRVLLLGCVLAACSLVSCKGIEITGKTEDVDGYTEAEAMIVLGSERNRYQNALGAEIWTLPVTGQQETSYGQYFTARVKEFLQDVKTLNLLAEEKGIIATSTEMEAIRGISAEFYEGLSEEDIAFMGNCDVRDVTRMYTEYFIACKTAEYLLSNVDSEVADADAKIIRVQQIVLSDRAAAEELHGKLSAEGASFSYYARQFSEDTEIDKTLAKSEKEDLYYTTAFALEENELSPVFEMEGKYYILKCVEAYDEEATLARKKRLEASIRSNAFLKSYGEYSGQHIVRFREEFWKTMDLSAHPGSRAENFFSLFEENISFR